MSIHKADVGTIFTITCLEGSEVLDVSDATSREVYFQKPNNGAVIGPFEMEVPNGGEDGICTYTFEAGQLDTVGEWAFQVHLEFPEGEFWSDWHDRAGKFTVYGNMI